MRKVGKYLKAVMFGLFISLSLFVQNAYADIPATPPVIKNLPYLILLGFIIIIICIICFFIIRNIWNRNRDK